MAEASYEQMRQWQLLITQDKPKPEGLNSQESAEYDNLKRHIENAAKLGMTVTFPND